MAWTRLSKFRLTPGKESDESGIALFMVIAAMTVLSVVVTEFTYVAQVNARATLDSSDTLKAHYLAKTGFKISLLRLRALKELKAFGKNGGPLPEIPKEILDQVWGFPFIYPIPEGVPGLTIVMKDEIKKFTDDSSLPGKFTAIIESEANKISINSLLKTMAPAPAPTPTKKAGTAGAPANPDDGDSPAAPKPGAPAAKKTKYDVEEARKGMKEFITHIIEDKFKQDTEFADRYRDLDIESLFDNILGWVDFTYQQKNARSLQPLPYKRAPFYSLSELHMVRPIDDGLYDLLAPNFTPFTTGGINVNKIQAPMLRAILVGITDQEVEEFFKFRDDQDVDNTFKKADDFYKWVGSNVASFRASKVDELKDQLTKQGLTLVTDEEIFKITVTAEVNKATRVLEAWVLLSNQVQNTDKPAAGGNPNESATPNSGLPDIDGGTTPAPNAAGLRVLFMRES